MLSHFKVDNFRGLRRCEMDFARINIFVGPNNSGKSNLIHAIRFLSDILSSSAKGSALVSEIDKNGGSELLNRNASAEAPISLSWRFRNQDFPDMDYSLAFRIPPAPSVNIGPLVFGEELRYAEPDEGFSDPFSFFKRNERKTDEAFFSVRDRASGSSGRVGLAVEKDDSILSQSDKLLESREFREDLYPLFKKALDATKDLFQNSFVFSSASVDLRSAKAAAPLRLGESRISHDGSDFAAVVHHLENRYDFLRSYRDILSEILPDLERIKVVHTSEKYISLRLFFENGQFALHEMSDGTVKAMLLALLIWSPEALAMLFIDEPELNLHPAWQHVTAHWILRARDVQQFFISTHSPDFLDQFTESFRNGETAIFVGTPEGGSSFRRISPMEIEESLKEGWELGDLYRVGDPSFGGWPW